MAFKLAITAGHFKYTPGKRCPKALDPKETREWVLNARIAEKVETILKDYDMEILRTDDRTGEKEVGLETRTDKANAFKADFYLSIHHNGLYNDGRTFSGGGIVAFVYPKTGAETLAWQKELYDALIKKTGLKGNRATPLAKKDLHEVRETTMPAVLLELGFMDSTKDCPVILTESYANKCAQAIAEVIIRRAGLTKKPSNKILYRVQVGSFARKENAEDMLKKVKAAGFEGYITTL